MTDNLQGDYSRLRKLCEETFSEGEAFVPKTADEGKWSGRAMGISAVVTAILTRAVVGPPFDAWSFIRDVLSRGASIERAADAAGWGYERLSASLDAAGREYADRLKPHLKPTEPK